MSRPKVVMLPNGCYAYEDTPNAAAILYRQILEYYDQGLEVAEGMTVFDVGANIGLFALEALYRTQGRIRIFCFEPAPKAFQCLHRSLAEQYPNSEVVALNVGLSSSACEATFFYRRQASAMSSFDPGCVLTDKDIDRLASTAASADLPREYEQHVPRWFFWLPTSLRRFVIQRKLRRVIADVEPVVCKMTTVDDVIRLYDVSRIDVLKIDVEGAEWEVLQGIGAGNWPKIQALAVEVHDIDGRLVQVETLLREQGFAHIRTQQEAVFRDTTVFSIWATRGNEGGPAKSR